MTLASFFLIIGWLFNIIGWTLGGISKGVSFDKETFENCSFGSFVIAILCFGFYFMII